ncbi:hypothetical protein DPMN_005416 [Dreissena polymorpha]|uniref:Uncharacterized protein n=1 Tax=Dreissena polymorpha TaxID=45954 RepID=A0A9D4RWG9_DREPO|nr:hypothetical protein DPMN_005416 [Dreissena polymorpha]
MSTYKLVNTPTAVHSSSAVQKGSVLSFQGSSAISVGRDSGQDRQTNSRDQYNTSTLLKAWGLNNNNNFLTQQPIFKLDLDIIYIQFLTKFGEDRMKFLGQTDRPTDRPTNNGGITIHECCYAIFILLLTETGQANSCHHI